MYGWGVWGGSCYRKGFTPNHDEKNKAINENYAVVTAKYGDNKPMPAIPEYESIFPSVATHGLVSKKINWEPSINDITHFFEIFDSSLLPPHKWVM